MSKIQNLIITDEIITFAKRLCEHAECLKEANKAEIKADSCTDLEKMQRLQRAYFDSVEYFLGKLETRVNRYNKQNNTL